MPVAVEWGRELSSLLAVYDTLSYNHDVLWVRLSALETTCEDARSSEAKYADVGRAEWKSLAGGVRNNIGYVVDVIGPALSKLTVGAKLLRIHFAKKFTARKAYLFRIGTGYVQIGVDE